MNEKSKLNLTKNLGSNAPDAGYEKDYKVTYVNGPSISSLGVSCLICGEFVELNENERHLIDINQTVIKVCDKCKNALMKIGERK